MGLVIAGAGRRGEPAPPPGRPGPSDAPCPPGVLTPAELPATDAAPPVTAGTCWFNTFKRSPTEDRRSSPGPRSKEGLRTTASIRFHERLGFEQVARLRQVRWKFSRWLDLVFLERLLGPEA